MVFSENQILYTTRAGLMFMLSLGSSIVLFSTLCLARRRNDPARACLLWMKIACLFFSLYCLVDLVSNALVVLALNSYSSYNTYDYGGLSDFEYAAVLGRNQSLNVGLLFARFTELLIFITLVTLSLGIIRVIEGSPGARNKLFQKISLAVTISIGVLAIAVWGLMVYVYIVSYGSFERGQPSQPDFTDQYVPDSEVVDMWNGARKIDFTNVVIMFIASLVMAARAVHLKVVSLSEPRGTAGTTYIVVCSILWLLRTTYNLVYQARYYDLRCGVECVPREVPTYLVIVEFALAILPLFIILSILLGLGNKRVGGLWSEGNGFMYPAGGPKQAHYGYENYDTPQQHQNSFPDQQYTSTHELQTLSSREPVQASSSSQYATQQGTPTTQYEMPLPPLPPQPPQMPTYEEIYPSLPAHDEAMGLNHQADGIMMPSAPAPYPEKN